MLVVTITKKAPIARPIPRPISGGVLPLDRAANLSFPKLMIALTIIGLMSWLGKWDKSMDDHFEARQPSVPCVLKPPPIQKLMQKVSFSTQAKLGFF